MVRFLSIPLLSVGLAACSVAGPAMVEAPSKVTLEQLAQSGAAMNARNEVGADKSKVATRPVAVLPADAGHIEKVASQHYADGLHQTVQYDQAVPGLKGNEIDLRLRTTAITVAAVEPLSIDKPSEAAIRAELASNFPKMDMRIVDHPRSNAYGVYGFAVGKWANGARCIYAWQWVDNLKSPETNGVNAASVRVRLCRNGGTLDQLASLVDGLQLEPSRANEGIIVSSAEVIEAPKPKPRKVATPRPQKQNSDLAAVDQSRRYALTQSPSQLTIPAAIQSVASSEPPLDPSLPAAAYRGPVLVSPAKSVSH